MAEHAESSHLEKGRVLLIYTIGGNVTECKSLKAELNTLSLPTSYARWRICVNMFICIIDMCICQHIDVCVYIYTCIFGEREMYIHTCTYIYDTCAWTSNNGSKTCLQLWLIFDLFGSVRNPIACDDVLAKCVYT